MTYFLSILLLVCFFQDVMFRGIYWGIFPLILSSTIIINWEALCLSLILWNTCYLLILLCSLTIYISIKKGKFTIITKGYFSWGDILILLAFVPLFFFEAFLFFVTVGTLVSLFIHLIVVNIDRKKTVPFAGYISLFSVPIVLNLENYNTFISLIWI